jgi:hypothetical protein
LGGIGGTSDEKVSVRTVSERAAKEVRRRMALLNQAKHDVGAVTLAYVHDVEVSHSWHVSLIELVGHDISNERRLIRGGWIAIRCGTDSLAEARNKAVRIFLDERSAEWFLWVDTDMGFQPDMMERLVSAADPAERPVVGALAFSYKELSPDGMGGYRCEPRPTILDWRTIGEESGFIGRMSYPSNSLIQCGGTGSAAILIHRSALEKVRAESGDHWYDRISNPSTGGNLIGEDLSFCVRLGAVGIPVFVHTGVRTSHHKDVWVSEPNYWPVVDVPPADEYVKVLVPDNVSDEQCEAFIRATRASTGYVTQLSFGEGDENVSPATRLNHLYRTGTDDLPWVLIASADMRLNPGWLDHALFVARERNLNVVGLVDTADPTTRDGNRSTAVLVRRSYIEELGACWDGPNTLAHEGYEGWPVDEIAVVARMRGTFGTAYGATVTSSNPSVYVASAADEAVLRERYTAAMNTEGSDHE